MLTNFFNWLAVLFGNYDYAIDHTSDPDKKIKLFIRSHRYEDALEYAKGLSNYDVQRDDIIAASRSYFDKRITNENSDFIINKIWKRRVKLESAAENYGEAGQLAEDKLVDYELASMLYQKGNLNDKALHAISKIGDVYRKIDFLINFGKYEDAVKIAKDLNIYESLRDKLVESGLPYINSLINNNDYLRAMELISLLKIDDKKEEVLISGRKYYDHLLAKASSDSLIRETYLSLIKFEELAGNYEIAGRLAEDKLQDYDLACSIYEKGNLFDKAINTVTNNSDSEKAVLKLAHLHENGGNIFYAAQLYEKAGDYNKATNLYVQLGKYKIAAECYKKYTGASRSYLAELFEKSGEFENAVSALIEVGSMEALVKAKEIAKDHALLELSKSIDSKLSELTKGSSEDVLKCVKDAERSVIASYSNCIGIDFGTTNSVGAVYNKVDNQVEIIPVPGSNNRYFEPSFFGIDKNNNLVFGEDAKILAQTEPKSVISRVKRSMGEGKRFTIGDEKFKGENIAAHIINHIKENADIYITEKIKDKFYELINERGIVFPQDKLLQAFNEGCSKHSFKEVVLTVPAFYNDNQKRAIKDAADVADLNVRRLLHEPTAAALAYGFKRNIDGKIVVIDFGGGTLDLSLLNVEERVYEVDQIDGDTKLGGSDIDEALLEYAIDYIKKTYNIVLDQQANAIEINRLRAACEDLKIRLSDFNNFTWVLQYFVGCNAVEIPLSREELESIASVILNRFQEKLKVFKRKIGNEEPYVLLVGNATKMPAIQNIAKKIFNSKVFSGIDPSTVVAYGAAVEGAVLSGDIKDSLLLDVVPYSLGVEVKDRKDDSIKVDHLIKCNTTIPCKKSEIYSTAHDNQDNVKIRIYQGESNKPDENISLGDFVLAGIPLMEKGKPQIEVTFDIGADCLLIVTAKEKTTGKENSITIDGAVALTKMEKDKIKLSFSNRKHWNDFNCKKQELENKFSEAEKIIDEIEREKSDFSNLFSERVEVNFRLYSASNEVFNCIQEMHEKMRNIDFQRDFQREKDNINSLKKNYKAASFSKLDVNDNKFSEQLLKQFEIINTYIAKVDSAINQIKNNILSTYVRWNQALRRMEPNYSQMTPLEAASSYMTLGKYSDAIVCLEKIETEGKEFTKGVFDLLLKCYSSNGMRDKYRNIHKKYGNNFGLVYPDFNHLDSYLNKVCDSIVMIFAPEVGSEKIYTGSGFAIGKNIIATNKHVIEKSKTDLIEIIERNNKASRVISIDVDPQFDLAILHVSDDFIPLNIGELGLVFPGENILAIGFPILNSRDYMENIYISKGTVNSIRKVSWAPGKFLYHDAKIDSGNSGGPLINELGEVIGVNTWLYSPNKEIHHLAIPAEHLKGYIG